MGSSPGAGPLREFLYVFEDLDWGDIPGEVTGLSADFGGFSIDPIVTFISDSVSVELPFGTIINTDNNTSPAFLDISLEVVHVPEPATLSLLGLGLGGLGLIRRRRS